MPTLRDDSRVRNALHFTLFTNDAGLLSKQFELNARGEIDKATAAQLTRGRAQRIVVRNLPEFDARRAALQPNQALAYGVTERPDVAITTQARAHERPDAIARTSKNFAFRNAPGILMLDHDCDHMPDGPRTPERLRDELVSAVPELADAPMLVVASASSYIYRDDAEMIGARGLRIYVPVRCAADIPRVLRIIYRRARLKGFGRHILSKSGRLLDRGLVDQSVGTPEHLDFAAGAMCMPPLQQRRPAPVFFGDPDALFDTTQIADLDPDEARRLDALLDRERADLADAAAAKQAEWIEARAGAIAAAREIPFDRAREIAAAAVRDGHLFADFPLTLADGSTITVGEVLDNRERYHGTKIPDPIEPDYGDRRTVAYVNLYSGSRPYVRTMAHGGGRYLLLRARRSFMVEGGDTARLADEVITVLRADGDTYDRGEGAASTLVRVAPDGSVAQITPQYLRDRIAQRIAFSRFDARSKSAKPIDPPMDIALTILARSGERDLRRLNAVITAPSMRPDGSIIDVPGYDDETGTLYAADDPFPPRVPLQPTLDHVRAAWSELWESFRLFPFADDVARAVFAAALLTACIRPTLDKAPAFGFSATAAGTGKTRLAECVCALTGTDAPLDAPPNDDAEMRKTLLTRVREGAPCIVFDNWRRPVSGEALDAFLTAATYSGRVLGASESVTAPNRSMLLCTGNALRTAGDTFRRILICEIDAQMERPEERSFDFDPLDIVRTHRVSLVVAALVVLRGYAVHGFALGAGTAGSFETWDARVRQAVVWLGAMWPETRLGDPWEAIAANAAEDPERDNEAALFVQWHEAHGDRPLTVRELLADGDAFDPTPIRLAIEAAAGGTRTVDERGLGYWLRARRGRVYSGLRLDMVGKSKAGIKWQIRQI